MVQNIKEELLKIGGKVELYVVQKPDIIYTNKVGEKIAIEVETGKGFKKHKKRLADKFEKLDNVYSGKVMLVLTNAKFKDRYVEMLGKHYPIFLRKDLARIFRSQIKKKNK